MPVHILEREEVFVSTRVPAGIVRRVARTRVIACVGLICVAAVASGVGAASASASCGSLCYGITQWPSAFVDGGISNIRIYSLSVPSNCGASGVADFWVSTDDTQDTYWVEEGMKKGIHYDGTCGNGIQNFWADNRPNYSYNEHYPGGSISFGTTYAMRIEYTGNNNWDIKRNGNYIGTSNNNPCCGGALSTGAESLTDQITINGVADGLQKHLGTTWSYGWNNAHLVNTNNFFTVYSQDPHSYVYFDHP
jgi:hypothetical protein